MINHKHDSVLTVLKFLDRHPSEGLRRGVLILTPSYAVMFAVSLKTLSNWGWKSTKLVKDSQYNTPLFNSVFKSTCSSRSVFTSLCRSLAIRCHFCRSFRRLFTSTSWTSSPDVSDNSPMLLYAGTASTRRMNTASVADRKSAVSAEKVRERKWDDAWLHMRMSDRSNASTYSELTALWLQKFVWCLQANSGDFSTALLKWFLYTGLRNFRFLTRLFTRFSSFWNRENLPWIWFS